jgi:hypothetical protein
VLAQRGAITGHNLQRLSPHAGSFLAAKKLHQSLTLSG